MYQEALKNQVKVQKSLETGQKLSSIGQFTGIISSLTRSQRKVVYHRLEIQNAQTLLESSGEILYVVCMYHQTNNPK